MTSFTNKNVLNLLRNLPRLSISNLRNNDGAVKKVIKFLIQIIYKHWRYLKNKFIDFCTYSQICKYYSFNKIFDLRV